MNAAQFQPLKIWQWSISIGLWGAIIAAAYYVEASPDTDALLGLSLLGGAIFGTLLQRSRFCFYCMTRDYFEHRQSQGLLGLIAALAVGLLGYHGIFGAFLPSPQAGTLPPGAHIGPISPALALGALLFGFGMALAGSCISAQLYRLGEGAFSALPVLAGVISGFIAGFWIWNPLYLFWIQGAPVIWLPAWLGYGGSLLLQLATLGALAWLLGRKSMLHTLGADTTLTRLMFVQRWPTYVGGILIGGLGTLMFLRIAPLGVTAELGSVARTLGTTLPGFPARLEGLDQFRGCTTAIKQTLLSHNGVFIAALITGSLASALPAGDFKPVWPNSGDIPRLMTGGFLMGSGAMIALGCTVGTLLSGIMSGALSGWIFALFCFIGTWAGWRLRKQ